MKIAQIDRVQGRSFGFDQLNEFKNSAIFHSSSSDDDDNVNVVASTIY